MRRHTFLATALAVLSLMAAPGGTSASAASSASSVDWLTEVALVRSLGGLAPVTHAADWSAAARDHSRYMAHNGVLTHHQDPTLPGATPAGAVAGRSANVGYGFTRDVEAVHGWLASPSHAFWLLNPAADRMGLGHVVAADGVHWWTLRVFDRSAVDLGVPAVGGVLWPSNGAVVPSLRADLSKVDDCGDVGPRGGVFAYWRSASTPTGARLTVDGRSVPTCSFSWTDDWHVAAATEETPPGSTVTVTFLGPGTPPTRTFRTTADPAAVGSAARPVPSARPSALACDGAVPDAFADLLGTPHAADVACVGSLNLARGFPDGTFRPGQTLLRGQTIAFTARLLALVGGPGQLAATSTDTSTSSTIEGDIARLGTLGLLPAGPHADPSAPMTRAEMAQLVRSVATLAGADDPVTGADWFADDDGHAAEAAIDWVAGHGIVLGTSPGTFAPDSALTRGQMATFLARTLALLGG